jgi:hypothetical protein
LESMGCGIGGYIFVAVVFCGAVCMIRLPDCIGPLPWVPLTGSGGRMLRGLRKCCGGVVTGRGLARSACSSMGWWCSRSAGRTATAFGYVSKGVHCATRPPKGQGRNYKSGSARLLVLSRLRSDSARPVRSQATSPVATQLAVDTQVGSNPENDANINPSSKRKIAAASQAR